MDRKTLLIGLALGALSALGPLATDMYLGALPSMASDLGGTDADMQLSVMTFFAGFTLGQLFYGPISDRTGRKPMVYVALSIFAIASLGCLFAATADQLLALRFLQGIGGSIGMVISTAVIRDLFTGHAATKLMSLVVLVLGISPILAPLVGSLILEVGTWRVIFAVLTGFAVLCAILVSALLPETRMQELRIHSKPADALKWYSRLLVSRSFIPYAGTLALVQGGFFAYIAGSSFVLINVYGLSPLVYSLVFGFNAVGLGIGTQIAARLSQRIGTRSIVKACTLVYAGAAVLLLAMQLGGAANLISVCTLLFVLVTALGGIMPSCNILTMESHGAIAGTAAALMGALGFGAGAASSFAIGLFDDGTALPMIAVIAGCAVASTLVAHLTFRDAKLAQPERA
ncbi:multidrug effflux MFS transporter [Rhizobium sp. KVB221]|uniref:Bcr/CflA family efflux transporter n=1 Tax=Rhizobium setariae TaxID=2801340 RepID=A0A936YMP5_9HYPH|nr:multidrug effflux MFS transporter [Rhizobium setariae]MBL0372333.1 multidrug effflux MFS transporter [Rhizobium setariae]